MDCWSMFVWEMSSGMDTGERKIIKKLLLLSFVSHVSFLQEKDKKGM